LCFVLPDAAAERIAVARADIRQLCDDDFHSESRYECVYPRCDSGMTRTAFVAKVHKRPVGQLRATDTAAAEDVVRFWKYFYGDDWLQFHRGRHLPPFDLLGSPATGYRVVVFVRGRPRYLGKRQMGDVYPTSKLARRAFADWKREFFGMFEALAWPVLRRKPVPGRAG